MTQPPLPGPIASGNGTSPIASCPTCHQPHQRDGKPTCTGHVTLDDGGRRPCIAWATTGVRVCQAHGASSPQVKAAVARRRIALEVDQAVRTYGLPRHIDPATGLIEEYWRTAGAIAWLEDRIGAMNAEDVVWGVAEEKAELVETVDQEDGDSTPAIKRDVKRRAAPSVWVQLYQQERAHFARLGADIIRLGLEARRDEWANRNSTMIVGMYQRALERAGLPAAVRATVEDALAAEITAMLAAAGRRQIEGRPDAS